MKAILAFIICAAIWLVTCVIYVQVMIWYDNWVAAREDVKRGLYK